MYSMSSSSGRDTVRELERQARQQMLVDVREASPQPIFGQPVKVELEDETSRRIKDTLGDFNQVQHVFCHDPKHLIGISRSSGVLNARQATADQGGGGSTKSTAVSKMTSSQNGGHPSTNGFTSGRGNPAKRPVPVNGLHKPTAGAFDVPGRRPPSSKQGPSNDSRKHHTLPRHRSDTVKINPVSSNYGNYADHQERLDRNSKDPAATSHKRTSAGGSSSTPVPNGTSATTTNNSGTSSNNGGGSTSSGGGAAAAIAVQSAGGSVKKKSVHNGSLPNGLVKSSSNNSGNNPDPPDSKKSLTKKVHKITIPEPSERNTLLELETIFKEMKQAVPPPLTAIQTPKTEERGFHFPSETGHIAKEDSSLKKSDPQISNPRDVPVPCSNPPKSNYLQSPTPKSPAASSFPFNLQEDLEMSESDDEISVVSVCKTAEAPNVSQYKSPVNVKEDQTGGGNMEKDDGPAASSSSESSDSDSEDSGSDGESNDSDSSASSECSDLETPSKPAPQMWGLSNFFDVTSRNHSPAFMAVDTNTNSSNNGIKEEPMSSTHKNPIDDDDSAHSFVAMYSGRDAKEYGDCSMKDLFTFEHGPIGVKTSALSPIPSPATSPIHVPPPIRGPRTPPSPEPSENSMPSCTPEEKEKPKVELKRNAPIKSESSSSKSRTEPKGDHQQQQHSTVSGRSKKKTSGKSPLASSLETSSSREQQHSASRDLGKTQDTAKDISKSTPVPSVAPVKTTHKSPVSSHRKHNSSSSSKKDSSSSLAESKSKESKHSTTPKPNTSSKHTEENRSRSSSRASSGNRQGNTSGTGKHGKHLSEVKTTEKSKESAKSVTKPVVKTSKSKPKPEKPPKSSKNIKENPRSDKKKKISKFSISNFVQSPNSVQSDEEKMDDSPPPSSSKLNDSSPDSSPVRTKKCSPVKKERKLSSSSHISRSRSRSASNSKAPAEKSNKRPASGSSERDKKVLQKETVEKSVDNSIASKNPSRCSLPTSAHPPALLSPIPSANDSAIPFSLMVRIPLSKLQRVPGHHSVKPSKDRPEESSKTTLPSSSLETENRPPSEPAICDTLSPSRKETKTKHRTDSSKVKTGKSSSERSSKPNKSQSVEPADVKSSASSTSSDKSSINSSESSRRTKPCKGSGDGQHVKKRKSSDTEDGAPGKKKSKSSSSSTSKPSIVVESELKDKVPVVSLAKLDVVTLPVEKKTTPRPLERCDSTGSLSSLCSQQSHKSSKSNKEKSGDVTKEAQDTRKAKTVNLIPAKDIKREKEDKPKVYIKKEPGIAVKSEKTKSRSKDWQAVKGLVSNETKKIPCALQEDNLKLSSQINYWDGPCKIEDAKVLPTNHQRILPIDYSSSQDPVSEWERFVPEVQQELKGLPNHINKVNITTPIEYYWTEGKKLKHSAEKETDPIQQSLKYFEATVMFIMSSIHREDSNKDPDSIYQMYKETLYFTNVIRACVQKHQIHSIPGNVDYKIHVLCLKCQSLLHLKLYNLKIKEVKEQHKSVSDFMSSSSSKIAPHASPLFGGGSSGSHSKNLSQPSPCQPRFGGPGSVPSPHSPTPSPAGSVASVGSQSSGYSSSDVPSRTHGSLQLPHVPQHVIVSVPQVMFDTMARHHMHLSNLYMCHELWQQADMYMMRSNSKEFFKEVGEKSERLSLHSTVKELVNYLQTGLSLLKDC